MPKAGTVEDITVEGMESSSVPRRSFCIISVSPPSWLEPNTTTLALLPRRSLARRANSLAERSNSEPGPPTWPSLISNCACAAPLASSSAAEPSAVVRARRVRAAREGWRVGMLVSCVVVVR